RRARDDGVSCALTNCPPTAPPDCNRRQHRPAPPPRTVGASAPQRSGGSMEFGLVISGIASGHAVCQQHTRRGTGRRHMPLPPVAIAPAPRTVVVPAQAARPARATATQVQRGSELALLMRQVKSAGLLER